MVVSVGGGGAGLDGKVDILSSCQEAELQSR